jgi:hypothetical protein
MKRKLLMCKCTPQIRTPYCGKPGCEVPAQRAREMDLAEYVSAETLRWSLSMCDWCDRQSDPALAESLVLAAMVQIVRARLDTLPPTSRAGWLRTLMTEGVGTAKATQQ